MEIWEAHFLKILISGYTIDPSGASESSMAWHWIEGAVLHGHQVHVLTSPDSARRVINHCNSHGISSVFVNAVPEPRLPSFVSGEFGMYFSYIRWQSKVAKYAKAHRLDVCDLAHHVSWGNIGLGTGLAKLNIPYVFGPCGGGTNAKRFARVFFDKNWKREQVRSLMVALLPLFSFARRGVRKASIVLATNQAAFQFAEKLGSKNTLLFLADGASDQEVLTERETPQNQEILWVARFMRHKGATLAVYAFASVLKRYPRAHLTMVGDGPTQQQAKALARELGISERINFMGRIPWDAVQHLYIDARCFLFSSLRDAFGGQVLEAATKGLPVVAINGSGVSEWMKPPAVKLAEPADPQQLIQNLASKIEELLTIPDSEWHMASDAALNFARFHSWSVKYEKMNQIYRAVLDEKNSRATSM